jgi:hypothetical protein
MLFFIRVKSLMLKDCDHVFIAESEIVAIEAHDEYTRINLKGGSFHDVEHTAEAIIEAMGMGRRRRVVEVASWGE